MTTHSSVDVVVCSAALLYMPVQPALREWQRILRPGGLIAFSSMRADQPPAASLFRAMDRARGLHLTDRSAALGSEAACSTALALAGFQNIRVHGGTVQFTNDDLDNAWSANERGHRDQLIAALDEQALHQFEIQYRAAIDAHRQDMATSQVLYAVGRKRPIRTL
jgi:SAM-dependent methyltransferase